MKTMKNVIKKTFQKIIKITNHKLPKTLPKKFLKLEALLSSQGGSKLENLHFKVS